MVDWLINQCNLLKAYGKNVLCKQSLCIMYHFSFVKIHPYKTQLGIYVFHFGIEELKEIIVLSVIVPLEIHFNDI